MTTVLADLDPFSPAEIARVSRRVTLSDGRGLGFAELGPPECRGMRQGRVRLLIGVGRHALSSRLILGAARRTILAEANGECLLRIRQRYVNRSQSDVEAFTEDCGRRMLACWREGLRRGVEGAASDARIYGEPWPFEPGRIKVPTDIWHGEDDRIVSPSVGRAYAAALPEARSFFLPREGHVSLIARYQDEIVDRLLARF